MEFNDKRPRNNGYSVKEHTCWNDPNWSGDLTDGCPGCKQAEQYPCEHCGYGHVFTTHNPEAHVMDGDPLIHQMGELAWSKMFQNKPYFPS